MEIPKTIRKEIEHFKKTDIPRCHICKKEFVNAYDSVSKEISKYLWKPDCNCIGKDVRISIG